MRPRGGGDLDHWCPLFTRVGRPQGAYGYDTRAQAGARLWPGEIVPLRNKARGPTPAAFEALSTPDPGHLPPQIRRLTGSMSMVPGGPGSPSAPGRPGRPGGPCGQRSRESSVRVHRDGAEVGSHRAGGNTLDTHRPCKTPGHGMFRTPSPDKAARRCGQDGEGSWGTDVRKERGLGGPEGGTAGGWGCSPAKRSVSGLLPGQVLPLSLLTSSDPRSRADQACLCVDGSSAPSPRGEAPAGRPPAEHVGAGPWPLC